MYLLLFNVINTKNTLIINELSTITIHIIFKDDRKVNKMVFIVSSGAHNDKILFHSMDGSIQPVHFGK